MKTVLVGEDNPYGADPRYALYPAPRNSAGDRLCRLVLGMGVKQYIGSFERQNLCSKRWSIAEARVRAEQLMREHAADGAAFVLLGSKVCEAFGVDFAPYTARSPWNYESHRLVILPHPSGRCRLWNAPGSVDRARAALRGAGILA